MKTGTFTAFCYIGREVRIDYCEDTVEIYRAAAAMTTSGLPCIEEATAAADRKSHGHTTIKEHSLMLIRLYE